MTKRSGRSASASQPRPSFNRPTGLRRRWITALGLFLATLAVFLPTLRHEFVNFDDPYNVYAAPEVTHGLSLRGVGWAFTHPVLGHWDPLTTLSHMLDCTLFGLQPWGHHLTNALIHAGAAALFFVALDAMTAAFWPALFAAALFAWHPLRVESVAWISERKDVLSAFFFMAALCAYARYVEKRSLSRYSAVAALFACGLLSKSMVVTLPCVLLLLDYWPLARSATLLPPWWLLAEKLPLLGLSAASSIVQLSATAGMVESIGWPERLANAVVCYLLYLLKLVWPASLAVIYPHPGAWPVWEITLAGAVLGAGSATAVLWRRPAPYLFTGWFWFLGMLLPVIGVVQIGGQSMADRYSYLPSAGVALMVAWGAWEAGARAGLRPRVLAIPAVGALLLCLALTERQIQFWSDSERLFRHAIAVTGDNPIAHMNLGHALGEKGELSEGIEEERTAVKLLPTRLEPRLNLGILLDRAGEIPEAVAALREAVQIAPKSAAAHLQLAVSFAKAGQPNDALAHYREAIALGPNDPIPHNDLGVLFDQCGRRDEAMAEFRRAVELNPDYAEAHKNLGADFYQRARLEDAAREFREVLRLTPRNADAYNNLAGALFLQGRVDEAIGEYRTALAIDPRNVNAQNNLQALLRIKGAR